MPHKIYILQEETSSSLFGQTNLESSESSLLLLLPTLFHGKLKHMKGLLGGWKCER